MLPGSAGRGLGACGPKLGRCETQGPPVSLCGHDLSDRKCGGTSDALRAPSLCRAALAGPLSIPHPRVRALSLRPAHAWAGLLRLVQGRTPQLLRHPCASAVVDELYNRASGAQRNMLAAEFFGREFALFTQVRCRLARSAEGAPGHVLPVRHACARRRTRRPRAWQPRCGARTRSSSAQSSSGWPSTCCLSWRRGCWTPCSRTGAPLHAPGPPPGGSAPAAARPGLSSPARSRQAARAVPAGGAELGGGGGGGDAGRAGPAAHGAHAPRRLCRVLRAGLWHAQGQEEGRQGDERRAAQPALRAGWALDAARGHERAVRAGHVRTMMEDEWAHVALLSALTHVDDTALLAKTLVPDILVRPNRPQVGHAWPPGASSPCRPIVVVQAHLDEVVVHRYARRVLLHLLAPDSPRYLPPHLHAFLHPTQPPPAEVRLLGQADLHALRRRSRAPTPAPRPGGRRCARRPGCQQEEPGRRMEVLESGPASLAHALVRACAQHAGAWLRSPTACDVVVEAARGGAGGEASEAHPPVC